MKEKIKAIISFIGALGWSFFGLFIIATQKLEDTQDFFVMFLLLLSTISTLLYVIWTKFGEFPALKKMDYENQLLKKQIEQKELKKKLEE